MGAWPFFLMAISSFAFVLLLAAVSSPSARADMSIEEANVSNMSCVANCSGGYCLNTQVTLEINISGNFTPVDYFVGNVLLNASQQNPVVLGTINTSVQANFTVLGGNYSFQDQMRCNVTSDYANALSAVTLVNVTDFRPPAVTLISPADNAARDPGPINFSILATDRRLTNCTLYGNWTPGWPPNETKAAVSNVTLNFTNTTLTYGKYFWNAFCRDAAGNGAYAAGNFTLNVAGDLAINSSQIWFNPQDPSETFNVTLFANVTNRANRTEHDVVVAFYLGDPDLGGTQVGNRTANFSGLSTLSFNVSAHFLAGTYSIFVVVDPPYATGGSIIESNELNNKANNTFGVAIWQVYYGFINASIVLDNSNNMSLSIWGSPNSTGNIYVAGTDTKNGISFSFLKALGRNTTGGADANTRNDFEDLDTLIGTAGYADSVNATFTSGGNPILTAGFTVFGTTLANVPVINSTNTSNFMTGILWDSDDSSNAYYDTTNKEDVVFVTKLNTNASGKYGTYDYELRVPAALRTYQGASGTVTFYYELT